MAYNTPETVADYLARLPDGDNPSWKGHLHSDHVKYSLTIASGGKDFSRPSSRTLMFTANPPSRKSLVPSHPMRWLFRDYGMDEFVDEFCDGMKPSAAIRAYNSCKETLTSGTCATRWRILISTVTSRKRSAKLPSIRSMTTTMPFSRGFPTTEWLEEAEFDGLLEGCKGDIYKMVQMAQYVYFKSDLYDHCEDICRYGTLDQLRDMGVYAIRESLADEILNDLSYDEDYAPTDDAKDTIISAIYATFEEKYGEDFADCADNFIQDNDDIAGRVNPCAMSVETVRAVYGMGFDAVFLNDWKKELAECDIDRKRFPLTAKRTIWKTAGMGLMVTPGKECPGKGR